VDTKQGYALSVQQTQPATQGKTRIDYYLAQLEATYAYLPKSAHYVVCDGFYSKIKWVDGVTDLKLDVISKLSLMLICVMSIQGLKNLVADLASMMARWTRPMLVE
jgi:hypothetical protein